MTTTPDPARTTTPDPAAQSPSTPDSITPDTKDWTWVLRKPCPECGFDTGSFPREQVGTLLRENAASWGPVLARPGVRDRPDPQTWSPLEYACHVRDVFRLYDTRLGLMLNENDPLFANWNQDETAVRERYGEQDPAEVGAGLLEAGERLATTLDRVTDDQWERPGRRSDGANFTVETFARYLIHDPIHHLHDVS
jgi:hypothetical protein